MVLFDLAQVSSAQEISGRFYPEKQAYLVGEPVFVVLDLANTSPEMVLISVSCTWLNTRFEALSAPKPHHEPSLFGCIGGGEAGSCGGSVKPILPGEHYLRRYLLDGFFRLSSPGDYPIRAWHKVDIHRSNNVYEFPTSQEVVL